MMKQQHHLKIRQSGFSMVEILVTTVVLSIGLLGVAAVQINTLRNNIANYENSVAVLFTNSIAERLKASKRLIIANNEDIDQIHSLNINGGFVPGGNVLCQIPNHNPISVVDNNVNDWLNEIQFFFGNRSCASVVCNNSELCLVSIYWVDSGRFSNNEFTIINNTVSL